MSEELASTDKFFIIFFGCIIAILLFCLVCPIICWYFQQCYIRRFCRLHPDWVEARNSLIDSGAEGIKLEKERKKIKEAIDALTIERRYIPVHLSYEMTDRIEELKGQHWKITDQIVKHNMRHEELRKRFNELDEKYQPKYID